MANKDFDRLFSSASSQQITHGDATYAAGWGGIVADEPPTKQQFDAIHLEADEKARENFYRSRSLYRADLTYFKNDLVWGADGILYIANQDVTGIAPVVGAVQWTPSVVSNTGQGGGGGGDLPVGSIVMMSGALPSGFFECTGAILDQATYPDLFAVIGTTYNDQWPLTAGGVTAGNFRLPYMAEIYPAHKSTIKAVGLGEQGEVRQHTHNVPKVSGYDGITGFSKNDTGTGRGVTVVPNVFSQNAYTTNPAGSPVPTQSTGDPWNTVNTLYLRFSIKHGA